MSNKLIPSKDKKWTLKMVSVPCKIFRTLKTTLPAGTNSNFVSTETTYQRTRTSTKSFVSQTNSVTTVFEHAVNSTVKVGLPLPVKVLPIKVGELSGESNSRFEVALSASMTVEESYETDTDVMFEQHEKIEFNSHDDDDYVVFEEKMSYGSTEVRSEIFCVSQKDWEDEELLPKAEAFEIKLEVPVDYYWFNLQTEDKNGKKLNLHVHMNKPELKKLIVNEPKPVSGQLWRWADGHRLCSRIEAEDGGCYYVKVANRSSRPNEDVIVWKGRRENNLAEEWLSDEEWPIDDETSEYSIKNGHGFFLSVANGSKGNSLNLRKVIVWNKFNDNPWQKWKFVFQKNLYLD